MIVMILFIFICYFYKMEFSNVVFLFVVVVLCGQFQT
jgi:hypothetical protein